MTTQVACPVCGTLMREIVWGYGTIADVADAGDVVIGGCVIDVDGVGRVAALQCPECGTRADEHGVALERPRPPDTVEHPFAVAFSSPPGPNEEVTMTDQQRSEQQHRTGGEHGTDERRPTGEHSATGGHGATGGPGEHVTHGEHGADASPYVDVDFGGIASGGDWRDHVEPYASREDELPQPSPSAPDRIDPYASREDALPERSAPARDHVDPYASREDRLPPASPSAPDRVDPYASREDPVPEAGGPGWRDRVEPFAPDAERADASGDVQSDARAVGGPGEAVPGETVPDEAVPGEAASDDAVPGEAASADAVPGEAVPDEAEPREP